ncbi:MAG: cation transporter [Holophaga sp.]|nr:cation transporter [Holophaga sp.]
MLKLKIDGMTCGHCAMHVKKALLDVPGVSSADVDLQAKEATIQGQADTQALVAAVEAEGYSAQLA